MRMHENHLCMPMVLNSEVEISTFENFCRLRKVMDVWPLCHEVAEGVFHSMPRTMEDVAYSVTGV